MLSTTLSWMSHCLTLVSFFVSVDTHATTAASIIPTTTTPPIPPVTGVIPKLPLLLQQVLSSLCQMSLVLHSLLVLSMNQLQLDSYRVHFDTVTLDNDRRQASTDLLFNVWEYLCTVRMSRRLCPIQGRPLVSHLCKGKFLNHYLRLWDTKNYMCLHLYF